VLVAPGVVPAGVLVGVVAGVVAGLVGVAGAVVVLSEPPPVVEVVSGGVTVDVVWVEAGGVVDGVVPCVVAMVCVWVTVVLGGGESLGAGAWQSRTVRCMTVFAP